MPGGDHEESHERGGNREPHSRRLPPAVCGGRRGASDDIPPGGGGVATPVNIVVEDDHAYFRSYDEAGKVKRLRRSSRVHIVPASWRGRPTGAAVSARARRLDGEEADHAARLLAAKHPLLHGRVVPLMHRLRGWKTVHYELRMVDDAEPQPFAAASFERRRRFHMAGPPQGNAT